jgi:hypothetical protein
MDSDNLQMLNDLLIKYGFTWLTLEDQQFQPRPNGDLLLSVEPDFSTDVPFMTKLLFRRDENEIYSFSSFICTILRKGDVEPIAQTFHTKFGIIHREAYNLMCGRAVYKDYHLVSDDSSDVWLQLDMSALRFGNHLLWRHYHHFNLEKALDLLPLSYEGFTLSRPFIISSLQQGNLTTVTFKRKEKKEVRILQADPAKRIIVIHIPKGKLHDLAAVAPTGHLRDGGSIPRT